MSLPIVYAHFDAVTTTLSIPNDVNVKIQICKFWGSLCTPVLADKDINICNLVTGGQGDGEADDQYYCAPAGSYQFEEEFAIPETAISNTNFAVNGVSFRIYVQINNEFTCHAQFTTIKSDSYASMGVSMLVAVALIMSGFTAFEFRRRRRRTVAQVDLKEEERQGDSTRRVHFEDHYVNL